MAKTYLTFPRYRKQTPKERSASMQGLQIGTSLIATGLPLSLYFQPGNKLSLTDCITFSGLISALPWDPWYWREWAFCFSSLVFLVGTILLINSLETVIRDAFTKEGTTVMVQYDSPGRYPAAVSASDGQGGLSFYVGGILVLVVIVHVIAWTWNGVYWLAGWDDPNETLLKAVSHEDIPGVRAQLKRGAAINRPHTNRTTALHSAVVVGNQRLVEFLLEAGANIDAQGEDGGSPLMAAVKAGQADVAQYLITTGADLRVKDRNGRTALQLAEERALADPAMFVLLRSAERKVAPVR